MTKLKIDLRGGILEVEGEEAFVREVYQDYKDKVSQDNFTPINEPDQEQEEPKTTAKPYKVKNNNSKTGSKRKESYQIVKNLKLSAKGGKESLKDFYAKKSPTSAMQRNTVFVYYLEKVAKVSGVGVNHIYTCYKDVSEKVPGALRQSLLDTSFKNGWIDTKSMENITITTHGENLVEHELQGKKEEK